jgi:hypothetical protein
VIGTGLTAVLPLAALAAAFGAGSAWSTQGGAAGAASLGISPLQPFVRLGPVWGAGAVLVLVCAFAIEPAAWQGLHRVRGGPLAAAAAWASLEAGEVRTLRSGGAVVMQDSVLYAITGDQEWELRAARTSPDVAEAGWRLTGVRLIAREGQVWTARTAFLRPQPARKARWEAPAASPWAMGPGRLWEAQATSPRASLVLHRRLALAAAVPLLAVVGWLLAWGEAPLRRPRWGLLGAVALAGGLFALARSADRAVADGLLSGALAGWLPLLPAAVIAVVLGWRAR